MAIKPISLSLFLYFAMLI